MKKLWAGWLALVLLVAGMAPAADGAGERGSAGPKGKKVRLTGTVSADGSRLVSDAGETWSVSNRGLITGEEGRRVEVKGYVTAGEHTLYIVSVKAWPAETSRRANVYDAAFRR